MADLDLNLLTTLDVLLRERSVTAAGRSLRISPSAMSRQLSRLREVMGDPVLVPAGRVMAPTPHALAIAERVRMLAGDVQAVLQPAPGIDIRALKRVFTVRTNEAFVIIYAARLMAMVAAVAPGVRLRFAPKPDKDIRALRDGAVDLDIGVISGDGAELRAQTLFHDRFVGVARLGHPLLAVEMTAERFAAAEHIVASRRGHFEGPVDVALAALNLSRAVKVVVPGFPAVLSVVAASDLVGLVPRSFCTPELSAGIGIFDLPVETPALTISQIWHPRMDADPAHRWLRALIFDAFH